MSALSPVTENRFRRPGRALAITALVVAMLAVGGGGGFLAAKKWTPAVPATPATPAAAADNDQLYTCGMHPNVIQHGPGECPICHMKLTPMKTDGDDSATQSGPKERKVLYWRAPMNPSFVSDKPGKSPMGMDLVPVYADASESATGSTIKIDPVTIQNMGIRSTAVKRGPLVKTIRTVGRVDYDEQTVAFIDTKFEGWIEKLYVDETGVQVEKGAPLFDVYSPKLWESQEEYLAALRGVERLAGSKMPEARDEAQRLVDAAEIQLRYYDITDEQIDELKTTHKSRKTLTINSPARGIVTEKMALEGMYVKPGMRLYTIADLSRVWVYVDIYEYQLPWVRMGQQATMTLPYIPGEAFTGRVVYIYPYLEKQSRVIKVRLEFENPHLELKPEMYANVMLFNDLNREALLVPREAYIDSGTRKVAFVVRDGGKFQPREIQVGVEAENGMVEVSDGLDEGDRVVTSGQFMLAAESKLKEAIAKAREPKQADTQPADTQPASDRMAAMDHAHVHSAGGIPADAKFACPMETHPNESDPAKQGAFYSAEPGQCDRCGMTLQPLEQIDWVQTKLAAGQNEVAYTCPDHPHVFSNEAGECPRCGKPLEPFKVMYACPDPKHTDVISATPGPCPHDGLALTPYRGIWLSPDMADRNAPQKPGVAEAAQYHCPLHPLVSSDKPGRCPICARSLERDAGILAEHNATTSAPASDSERATARFVCPMHPLRAVSDQRGTCPICGMQLVAAKLLANPTTAPAAIATQVNFLMEHYLELQKRFASDRGADTALHALGLVGAADEILRRTDQPDVASGAALADAVRALRAAAVKTTGKSLDDDRATFVALSNAMRKIVDIARPDPARYPRIYIYHCPMTKGDWLQTTDQMANPFYGFKMLKCGALQATK